MYRLKRMSSLCKLITANHPETVMCSESSDEAVNQVWGSVWDVRGNWQYFSVGVENTELKKQLRMNGN